MSRQHVIPQWVSKVLAEDPRGWPNPFRVQRHYGGVPVGSFGASKVINLITKRVCKVCNEGWLEQLVEHPTQPILDPMLRGREAPLDLAEQSMLAAWVAKTAMEFRYALTPPEPVAAEWLTEMYEHQLAPETWYIWVTSYQGYRPVFAQHNDITLSFPVASVQDGSLTTPHGVLVTLVVGYVAFKVMGIKAGTPSYAGTDAWFRLWPLGNETFIWPPQRHLDEISLPGFVNMYLDQTGEPPPPLPQ